MAVQYQQGSHSIYVHKDLEQGVSPLTPENPSSEIAVDNRPNFKAMAVIAMGISMAHKTISGITSELDAMGHESLAASIGNAVRGVGMMTAIVATKGLAIVPILFDGVADTIIKQREEKRFRNIVELELKLKGSRVSFNQGRVYNE